MIQPRLCVTEPCIFTSLEDTRLYHLSTVLFVQVGVPPGILPHRGPQYLVRVAEYLPTSSKLEEFQLIANNVMAETLPQPGGHGEPPQPDPPFSPLPRPSSRPVTGQSNFTPNPSLRTTPVNVGQQSHAPPVDSTENVPKFSRRNADTAPWM